MNSNITCKKHYEMISEPTCGVSENMDTTKSRAVRPWKRFLNNPTLVSDQQLREPVDADTGNLTDGQKTYAYLHEITCSVMNNLRLQLKDSAIKIRLTDNKGSVINLCGDTLQDAINCSRITQNMKSIRSEFTHDREGLRTCFVEKWPFTVHNNEHFISKSKNSNHTTLPVHCPSGDLIAILDATSNSRSFHEHIIDLLNNSVRVIENQLLLRCMKKNYIIRFHSQPELISTPAESLIAFNDEGTVSAANRSAHKQLNLSSTVKFIGQRINQYFDLDINQIWSRENSFENEQTIVLESINGTSFFANYLTPDSKYEKQIRIATTEKANRAPNLDDLEFGDAKMHRNIDRAKKLLERDIPFILLGETGTGKDVFANAIHQQSSRSKKPFIAVNCASIPETLIESELFGYRPGAFTGASKEGSRGKIVQADGGTLFLDEIGDMPLHLQARLLRVLEEREVIPLGGETAKKVDIRLISATHKELPQLVEEGRFRIDLYYRLNGISLQMPPLRDREDKQALIDHLLKIEAALIEDIAIEQNALNALYTYQWPGNFRQLRNTLRTIIGLCDDNTIRIQDLPDEIFEANLESNSKPKTSARKINPLEIAERDTILREMELAYWNVTQVASKLGVSRNTLYRKMRNFDIRPPR
ncbi:MAG: sigma-54-dependent Fis family transcriptional regulator [Candidatus Thiodiazotropha sp.]